MMKSFFYESGCFLGWLRFYLRKPKVHQKYSSAGEHVVVVGNGPSAKDFPFLEMREKGYKLCCVNNFCMSEELFHQIKPQYYCCVDPGYFEPNYPNSDHGKEFFRIMNSVDWDITFITHAGVNMPFSNPHITIHYLNDCAYRDTLAHRGGLTKVRNYLFDRNMAHVGFQNVMVAATFYFVMTRAAHVLLTGGDSDWHRELVVGEDNDVYREYIHFYGVERINVTQTGQIGKGQLYLYMYFYYQTLRDFANVAQYAEYNHVPVTNTCLSSYIDVFPKKPVEEFLK